MNSDDTIQCTPVIICAYIFEYIFIFTETVIEFIIYFSILNNTNDLVSSSIFPTDIMKCFNDNNIFCIY